MYFHGLIPDGMFTRCARWNLKSAYRIARMMKGSDLPPVRWTSQPEPRTDQPEGLTFLSLLTFDALTLTMQKTAALIGLTTSPIGLTLPSILTADDGVKTPSSPDVRTTCFDIRLLDAFVRLLATSGRHGDVEVFYQKKFNMLKTKVFCSQIVYKYFDDVQKLTSSAYGRPADKRFELRLEVCDIKSKS